jgi:hypothetical protein
MSFEKLTTQPATNSDLPSASSRISIEDRERAAEAVERLSSYFHPIETGDARIFLSGAIELFARYPKVVTDQALDVSIGLPSKHKFWPRISEIKETLDELHGPIKFAKQWDERAREQIAARRTMIEHHTQRAISAPTPAVAWNERFGISKEAWDAIPDQPETFKKLPTPSKEDTTGPPGEDAA